MQRRRRQRSSLQHLSRALQRLPLLLLVKRPRKLAPLVLVEPVQSQQQVLLANLHVELINARGFAAPVQLQSLPPMTVPTLTPQQCVALARGAFARILSDSTQKQV